MVRPVILSTFFASVIAGSVGNAAYAQPAPVSYPDEPACQVMSVQQYPSSYAGARGKSPTSDLVAINQPDANGVYQLYMGKTGSSNVNCLTCTARPGAPSAGLNKMMVTWHPSGKWLFVGVEETTHDLWWMPKSWQIGLMQSGIWLNMWATTRTGDRWWQLTNFNPPWNGPSSGFVGVVFTPNGKTALWTEIVDGNIFVNSFGVWKLYRADFSIDAHGTPQLTNKTDITPAGARWVEPGNVSPDGRHLLLSTDIGTSDAQGQDQWALDIFTGELKQLTNTPTVWDEHGVYSPSGKKISFMSSYPYADDPTSNKTLSLRTEFMLMDADGSHLQQLTHFNVPGYPESQANGTVAALAGFVGDGSTMFAAVLGPNFTITNWNITFQGRCGGT